MLLHITQNRVFCLDIGCVILSLVVGGLYYTMTSLARQLERLKVPGAHSRLGLDTRRTSLIFNQKEAANEDRLSVYHLGMETSLVTYVC